jgi:2,5-diketo-D-gluconate reductase A
VRRAIAAGFRHVHTAYDYFNLPEVGVALAEVPREELFVSSMVSPCIHPAAPPKRNETDPAGCFNLTLADSASVLASLGLKSLDLLMLHGPSEPFGHKGGCDAMACELNAAQWRALSSLLRAGTVRSIGVSNFCRSCLSCLLDAAQGGAVVVPAVNQVQLHVGQHADPGGLISHCAGLGVAVQAYEPLAGGAVADDPLCASVGAARNRTAAEVGLRWVLQRAPSLAVRAGSDAHLRQDLDVWGWALTQAELAELDAASEPKGEAGGRCSWGCTE